MTKDPTYLDLAHCSAAPCREFLFGTDTMGPQPYMGPATDRNAALFVQAMDKIDPGL